MSSNLIDRILLLAFPMLIFANVHGQGCAAVDAKQPLIFISYERTEENNFLLALHNNTTCAIYVTSNVGPSTYRITKLSDGRNKLEKRPERQGYDLANGELLSDLRFDIREARWSDRRTSTTADGDTLSTRRLSSNVTIYFYVRRSSFTETQDVVVPFLYEWEENEVPVRRGDAVHQLYFSFPGSLIKRSSK